MSGKSDSAGRQAGGCSNPCAGEFPGYLVTAFSSKICWIWHYKQLTGGSLAPVVLCLIRYFSVEAKYVPTAMIAKAIIKVIEGISLKIANDNPTPINGDTA